MKQVLIAIARVLFVVGIFGTFIGFGVMVQHYGSYANCR